MTYIWDEERALFRREGYQSIAYCDGPEVEQRLLGIVRNAKDKSVLSPELAASISDWPSEYHLSPLRHCLLRPLSIRPGDRVLELGCGCGAITRYLGEIGAEVVAVEGSLSRAQVAAERCRELPNVKVFADDLLSFEAEQKFDWILLIGVLEYAPAFSAEPDPVQHYLQAVTHLLAPRGRVVVAIENKLGLKYFNGCGEDHLGVPFLGVQDLYQPRSAQTFGREELIGKLHSAGLQHTHFRYPFPDYKLPTVILSSSSLSDVDFDPVDLLSRCHARDYTGWRYRSFDDALAFESLYKNGLLADLSNSFLVEASTLPLPDAQDSELAATFSVSRAPEHATQTRFVRSGEQIRVIKKRLLKSHDDSAAASEGAINGANIVLRPADSQYEAGRQILWRLLRARARRGDLEAVVEALHPWAEFLLQHARVEGSTESANSGRLGSYQLPGKFIDCTPFNLLEAHGKLVAIDLEWQSDSNVSLGWVITRGVLWSLFVGLPVDNQIASVDSVVQALATQCGLSAETAEISHWLGMEADFQALAGGHKSESLVGAATSNALRPFVREIADLQGNVQHLQSEREEFTKYVDHLTSDLAAVGRAREDNERALGEARAALGETRAALGEVRAALSEAHAAVAAARTELRETSAALGETRAELRGTRAALQQTEAEREHLRQKLAAGTSELEFQARQLAAIRNSKTWRLATQLKSIAQASPVYSYKRRRQLQDDLALLSNSKLFNPEWYLANNADVAAAGVDAALHYLQYGGNEGRDASEAFSSSAYLQANPDVRAAGLNPLVHYLRHGAPEGRPLFPGSSKGQASPATVEVGEAQTEAPDSSSAIQPVEGVFDYFHQPADLTLLPAKVAIGVSSLGNFFMTEIAHMVEHAFRSLGVETKLFSENDARAVAGYDSVLIVAPHEFFLLGEGPAALDSLRRVPRLIMYNVEQRQSQWFRVAEQYLPYASAIFDINYQSAQHLAKTGYKTFFFPLGYSSYIENISTASSKLEHEICRHLSPSIRENMPSSYAERPIDILFIGASSTRRKSFFAQHAAYFAAQNSFIYMPDTSRPFLAAERRTVDFSTFASLVKRSKLLLNVHQGDEPFFEWQRIVTLGMMQQTLVVTDHCERVPFLSPEMDYLDGPLDSLPGLCELALHDIAEAERIANRAYKKLKTTYPIEEVLAKCWSALVQSAS